MQIVLYLTIIIAVLWSLFVFKRMQRIESQFNELSRVKSGNLGEVLSELLKTHKASKKEFRELYQEIERLDREKTKYIQKVSLVRFNPFEESEYEQSFALALLDAVGTGVVVTSIHTNNRARVYTKAITRGQSKIELSPEEKNAIQLAIKSNGTKVT